MVERLKFRFGGKATDTFGYSIDYNGDTVVAYREGYAPTINGLCSGDYFYLEIDVETGTIVGWNQESKDDIMRLLHATD